MVAAQITINNHVLMMMVQPVKQFILALIRAINQDLCKGQYGLIQSQVGIQFTAKHGVQIGTLKNLCRVTCTMIKSISRLALRSGIKQAKMKPTAQKTMDS